MTKISDERLAQICNQTPYDHASMERQELARELQSLRSPQPAGVRVKGLRWVEVNSIAEQYAAHSVVGSYFAVRNDRGWKLCLSVGTDNPEKLGLFVSLDEAKAAAEADYRQRILSAVEVDNG